MLGWKIARLGIYYNTAASDLKIPISDCHAKFEEPAVQPEALVLLGQTVNLKNRDGTLVVQVHNNPINLSGNGTTRLYTSDTWEFWIDRAANYVFLAPFQNPPCKMIVTPDFSTGEVWGDFKTEGGQGFRPVWNLEIRLFSAWLASFGDVILHASGIKVNDKGYVFIGESGAGKSTLAEVLSRNPSVTILGEDQIILRYLEDRFWVFGTPWHLDPTMCSPQGAPLEKLFFLDRSQSTQLKEIKPMDGMKSLLQNAFIPYYRQEWIPAIMDRFEKLIKIVPCFLLSYQLGTDPWQSIRDA